MKHDMEKNMESRIETGMTQQFFGVRASKTEGVCSWRSPFKGKSYSDLYARSPRNPKPCTVSDSRGLFQTRDGMVIAQDLKWDQCREYFGM